MILGILGIDAVLGVILLKHGGQGRIFFWLNLTLLLRRLLRSTRHAKKRRTLPRLTLELQTSIKTSFCVRQTGSTTPASPWNHKPPHKPFAQNSHHTPEGRHKSKRKPKKQKLGRGRHVFFGGISGCPQTLLSQQGSFKPKKMCRSLPATPPHFGMHSCSTVVQDYLSYVFYGFYQVVVYYGLHEQGSASAALLFAFSQTAADVAC